MSLIAVDLDGTLIENRWPHLGDWLPGARESVHAMLDAGHEVYVYTARLYHLWPNGQPRSEEVQRREFERVRLLLDQAGLFNVGIRVKEPYDLMIDDRVLRFTGGWASAMAEGATILRDGGLLDASWDAFTAGGS